jgi:hypothetical protein
VGELIAAHWLTYWLGGRRATVARWLDGLPEEAITATPPVALVAAWIGGFGGASKQETERWLAAAGDAGWEGMLPDGVSSMAFGVAMARATMVFDDAGRSAVAARRALELAGPQPSPSHWTAKAALGHGLYLSGHAAEARLRLEELVSQVPAAEQPYDVATALAVLSLLADDQDDPAAASLARRALAVLDDHGLSFEPLCGIVYLALGRTLAHQGELAEAEAQLERALELFEIDSMSVHRRSRCCWHRCVTVGASWLALGPWLSKPVSWSSASRILACFPRCWSRPTECLVRGPAGGSRWTHPCPSASWRSCGCSPPACRPGRSAANSLSRSTPSAARSRPSIASSRSPAGPRRLPTPASSACSPGRHPPTGSHRTQAPSSLHRRTGSLADGATAQRSTTHAATRAGSDQENGAVGLLKRR